jgi:hypothetical protein
MRDDFVLSECAADLAVLFDHERADRELGASIFWARPSMLFRQTIDEFIAFWQSKRGDTLRGIVEVIDDPE